MNDTSLAITKLEELAHAAFRAESEFEKAAVFGAVRALIDDLGTHIEKSLPYLLENVERARWSICAILGYDITNQHSDEQHLSWALAALIHIRDGLAR